MIETSEAKKGLETPGEVMRKAYGSKLESLRRRELEQLFDIHGIEYGDWTKDDLLKVAEGYAAMGYDFWTRPENQPPPKFTWPGGKPPGFEPRVAENIEGSGEGRTTRDVIEAAPTSEPEPSALPSEDRPIEALPEDDVAGDEWEILKPIGTPQLKKMVKDLGLKQPLHAKRQDLTTLVMIQMESHKVEQWIAENGPDQDVT